MGETTTLSVHRCRFVDFTPASITALAFPPLPLPPIKAKGKNKATLTDRIPKFGPLIVGHSNGNIEIYEWTGSTETVEAPQAWVVRKTLSGTNPSKVDSLALALKHPDDLKQDDVPSLADLRLFSSGGGSELTEWDMIHGAIRRTLPSQGGAIWSISANPASTILALGCEDGSIQLISLEFNTFQHLRRLDRSKSRILALAWGPPLPRESGGPASTVREDGDSSDEDEDVWQDSWIVAGCSDSSLRKWDVSSGKILDRMGTDKIRGERTLVWTVGVLGDGTIISGDSLGMVKFWDSRTCTQLQSFEAHGADVLCLVVGPDGTSVFTSGIDQKVTQFSLVESSSKGGTLLQSPTRWVRAASKRMHSHDVRGLSIWPPYTPMPSRHRRSFPTDVAPLLVSGGLDMSVVVTPAATPRGTTARIANPLATSITSTFEDAYQRRIAYSSGAHGTVGVHLAKRARLVLSTGDTILTVWRLPEKPPLEEEQPSTLSGEGPAWHKILEMSLRVQTNIVTSAISDDGRWLAVSDDYEVKLFWLQADDSSVNDLKPKRIRDLQTLLREHLPDTPSTCGASALSFSPDSSKLIIATTTAFVLVLDLSSDSTSARVIRRFDQHRSRGSIVEGRALTGRRNDNEADVASEPEEDSEESDAEPIMVDNTPSTHETANKPTPATVTRMAISPDGQWLATTDDHRRTHVFNLDAVQHHTSLPSFPQPTHALAFAPSTPSLLILGFANNTLELYDVETRQFPPWSRELCTSLPKRFTHLHDAMLGVTLAPLAPQENNNIDDDKGGNSGQNVLALFWGPTWLCKVQFAAPVGWGGFEKKKRRRRRSGDGDRGAERDRNAIHNFKLVTQYRQILLADFIAPRELVVVERPLTDVLANLPPAYYRPKYGAS